MTAPAGEPVVAEVGPEAAAAVLGIVHRAFGPRPPLDPPATALEETIETVAAALAAGGGLLATLDGTPVGALIFVAGEDSLHLRRVSVVPERQNRGVAKVLATAAEDVARRRGFARLDLLARAELPATVGFWLRHGYRETARTGTRLTMAKELPVTWQAPTADAMRELGRRLAPALRPGDVLVLSGELGAGKTTFTQGLGEGLRVRGHVTSPTFVIARIHPSLGDGPPLLHVDAYRIGGVAELDDLDLDVSVEDSVTVVEWGEGLAETLTEDRLEVRITRSTGAGAEPGDGLTRGSGGGSGDGEDPRLVLVTPVGARWVGSGLADRLADPVGPVA